MLKYCLPVVLMALLVGCKEEKVVKEPVTKVVVEEKPPVVKEYGFNLEDFDVLRDTVRKGDSFGELMLKNKVDYPKIAQVSESFRDTFDVRKIVVGKPYLLLRTKDTTQMGQVFIYENDRINYTVVDFRDTVQAYNQRKEVKQVWREASGVINSSLSETLLEQGVDYHVTNKLSEIYAWTIDFFRLQKGDRFKVIYEENYINDSIYAGAGTIKAAYFEHKGRPIYAFGYNTDSIPGIDEYYDEAADNLRRAFLSAPVSFSQVRISSRYNLKRRIAYYGNRIRPHKGTDYAAPVGTPILATADGTVVESTRRGGNGKYVKIRHNGTYSTQYLHMKAQNVRKGDYVRQGDVIGWIGMTGNTSGPHVCYRFWKNGRQVDPYKQDLPAAEPIDEKLRQGYMDYVAIIKNQLDCIPFPEEEEQYQEPILLTENQKNAITAK